MDRATGSWQMAAAQLFFPQRQCLNCGREISWPGFCAPCWQQAAALPRCPRCATFLLDGSHGPCLHCRAQRPAFVLARAAGLYQGELRANLRRFKYQQQTWLRRSFAAVLARLYQQEYAACGIEALLAIPLAAERLAERGYNQSALLAEALAPELKLPVWPEALRRVKETPPLAAEGPGQRQQLLRDAFAAQAAVAGKKLLLVDDIYTSGATCRAAAQVLRQAGAAEVYVLTVAAGRQE